MSQDNSGYVFLMTCSHIGEAQVVKSFLESQGFHPRVRDEQTRGVAPHLGHVLGRLTLDIPEIEYMAASQALENREAEAPQIIEEPYENMQDTAKKALWNAILGCFVLPLLCNFYSLALGYRVLRLEKPLSSVSRKRLMLAILFNSIAFYIWLTLGPHFIKQLLR